MRDKETINKRIIILQTKINKKILECDSLTQQDIYQLSRELDCEINHWYRATNAEDMFDAMDRT